MIVVLRHAFNTWLVAHAIHPFVWAISLLFMQGTDGLHDMSVVAFICVIAMLFSIPAIFLFWFLANCIICSCIFPKEKFFLWLAGALLITAINAWLLVLVITNDPFFRNGSEGLFLFAIPSIVATALSVAVRYEYFFQLNKLVSDKKRES